MRLLIPLLAVAVLSAEESTTTFAKVQPILEASCVKCHGAKKPKHDLRLDSLEGVLKGGKELGPAAIAGKPDQSPLLKVLRLPADDEVSMPPKGKGEQLSDEQVALIRKWISEGAKP